MSNFANSTFSTLFFSSTLSFSPTQNVSYTNKLHRASRILAARMQFVAIVTALARVNVYPTTLAIRINRVDPNVYAIQIVRHSKRALSKNVAIPVRAHAAPTLNAASQTMCRHACAASVIRAIRIVIVMWSRQHVSNIMHATYPTNNLLIYFSSPLFLGFPCCILTTVEIAIRQEPPTNPCQPSPCGPNSQCRELNGQAVCSCLERYIGVPPNCRPECVLSTECPYDKACINQRCQDPCPGTCGTNAECRVRNHSPLCQCRNGFTGDAFTRCYPIPRKRLSNLLPEE